jgi:hypothetical protein
MRVRFERSGGVAGNRLATTVDSNGLPPDEARNLEGMIQAVGFFELPPQVKGENKGADRFQYRLTVEAGDRAHTVAFNEGAMPAPLESLVTWLTKKARESQGS